MTSDATDPADAPDPEATPPRDSRGRFTPRENAEPDAEDAPQADAEADARERRARMLRPQRPLPPPPDAAPPPDAPAPPAIEAPLPPNAPPQMVAAISIGDRLRGYARRLAAADARPLAAAVVDYAARVDGVARGDLSPSAGANPSALTPALVGEALGHSGFARVVEIIRNALIFTPVLWTWIGFWRASAGYADSDAETLLDHWLSSGLDETLIGAIGALAAIVLATLVLGFLRWQTEREQARTAREFAALLAEAEGVGAGRRADDPQEAIAAFASAGRSLTDDLRAVGGTLTAATRPLTDSVDIARAVMADVAAAIERQQEQIAAIAASLAGVSQVADRLGALEASFAAAQDATKESAAALDRIRASLDPRTEELSLAVNRVADLASRMERAADQIARATEDYGKSLRGFADGAEQLGQAARTMNAVAIRLRDDMAASP